MDGCGGTAGADHERCGLASISPGARGAEVVAWGSTDALEAVKRICQAVAVRCGQAIGTQHHAADAPDNQVSVAS